MYFGYAFETKDQEVQLTKYNSQPERKGISQEARYQLFVELNLNV